MATLTVTELSTELEATPRMVRKFLRSITPLDEQPGKGGRWQIEKAKVRTLKKKFTDFKAEHVRPVDLPEDEIDTDETE